MRMESKKSYADRSEVAHLFSAERFYHFANDFDIDKVGYISSGFICNSSMYFARYLSTMPRQAVIRKDELLSNYRMNMDPYQRLFDHSNVFKTKRGAIFITSMPYLSVDEAEECFNKIHSSYPETRPIEMFLLPHEYKYKKNGNYMFLFCQWMVAKVLYPNLLHKDFYLSKLDEWSCLTR